jgi:hypothetical protein
MLARPARTRTTLLLAALVIAACGSRTGLELDTGSLEHVGTTTAPDGGGGSGSGGSSGGVGPVLCGPTPTVLATGQRGTVSLAVDDSNVYWTNQPWGDTTNGSVQRVALAGGTPTTLASSPSTRPACTGTTSGTAPSSPSRSVAAR